MEGLILFTQGKKNSKGALAHFRSVGKKDGFVCFFGVQKKTRRRVGLFLWVVVLEGACN